MISNQKFVDTLIEKEVLSKLDAEKLNDKYNGDHYALCLRLGKGVRGGGPCRADIGRWWADSIGYSYIELGKTLFQNDITEKLTEEQAREFMTIPIYKLGEAVTLAMGEPQSEEKQKELESIIKEPVSLLFSFPEEIESAIDVQYQSSQGLEELTVGLGRHGLMDAILRDADSISSEQLQEIAGTQAVVELARGILLMGLKEGASDIHIEQTPFFIRVRYRIDGLLVEKLKLGKDISLSLVSRLKIMANLDITERRKPQDGRIVIELANRPIEFRFSSAPTINGEKIVLRILGKLTDKSVPDMDELAFSGKNLATVKNLVSTPNGVIFVSGPTGSGKTTTLFSMLKHISRPDLNVVTIEDPIEYNLPGINQVQVNHSADLDFATALRSFLRQDPDVILVGEIRDLETARIASQAALTGHLVMTTLHTNNALQAVTRLVEIGVEPFLVAPAVIGVLAQRLVRRLCDFCKEKYFLTPDQMNDLFIWDGKTEVPFYKSKGCGECKYIGYKGRLAIHEVFILNDKMREKISEKCSILQIQKMAHDMGFKTMRYDGLKKAMQGYTSLQEVDRVTLRENEMYDVE